MILSQEEKQGSHKSAGRMAKELNISKRTVRRISKRLGLKNYKRQWSVTIPPSTKQKRLDCSKKLLTRFPLRKVNKMVFQDEKDFTLEVPTNRQNKERKGKITEKRLYHEGTSSH